MDSLLAAAARSLAGGDPLAALKRVALRSDAPALALRGIAMAQLGELDKARALLRRAFRKFSRHERLSRARCLAAEAEVALAQRDLMGSDRALASAIRALDALGDRGNALHARLVAIRRVLLLGRIEDAKSSLDALELSNAAPALAAIAELARAEIELRGLKTRAARKALDRARAHAERAGIGALVAEVDRVSNLLEQPAARMIRSGQAAQVTLEQVEACIDSGALMVDACRNGVRAGARSVALAKRPVLFSLARLLGEAWPDEVSRDRLAHAAFCVRVVNESHRARLRVELGRLRRLLAGVAEIAATSAGFRLEPLAGRQVVVIAPLVDDEKARVLAVLEGGEAWATSALALALGVSQRTAQRALAALEAEGRARAIGKGRAQRWRPAEITGFATPLLLPSPPASG